MSRSPIEIIQLLTYTGPNIFGPQPGVLLRVRCESDLSKRIKAALKDGAQFIGMVLAYLEVVTVANADGFVVQIHFITPTPALGADLAAYVVDGVRAEELGDVEWDRDTPLFALQQRRRHEAIGVPALQLIAEARARNVPVLILPDGRLQLGYGQRGWVCDPTLLTTSAPVVPPWPSLGTVPIYAVTGERDRSALVQRVASLLQSAGRSVCVLDDASYAATLALLADPATERIVVGLRSADILRHGLAFSRCTVSIITDMDGKRPPEASDDTEWARALGVPMLVAAGPVVLNTADPAITELASYAPHAALPLSALETVLNIES